MLKRSNHEWLSLSFVGDHCVYSVLNAEKYVQIFIHHAIPSGRNMINPKCKHAYMQTMSLGYYVQHIEEQGDLEVMVLALQSLDSNIIKSNLVYKRE